jgi:transposase
MAQTKLTKVMIDEATNLLKNGVTPRQLANRYGVHISVIYRKVKHPYEVDLIPVETKKKVIKAIKQGHSKAEAGNMYGVNIDTVYSFTRNLTGHRSQGNHIVRQTGIKLLNRLMNDGFLISDFNVPVVRNLQMKFPIIRSARFKDKTFFYLPGREETTIEAFFKEKPDRIISYKSIEEMSFLLGVKFSKKNALTLVNKYKDKHNSYWRSRRLVQRCIDDWVEDSEFTEIVESSFRIIPRKNGEG